MIVWNQNKWTIMSILYLTLMQFYWWVKNDKLMEVLSAKVWKNWMTKDTTKITEEKKGTSL